MLTRVEALNYRCLSDVSQPLDQFRMLVGPNASGKSTFLDVLRFIRDVLTPEIGVAEAVSRRVQVAEELLSARRGDEFQLAVELCPPRELLPNDPKPLFRYELAIGCPESGPARINAESLWFYPEGPRPTRDDLVERTLFPAFRPRRRSLMEGDLAAKRRGRYNVVAKVRSSGRDYFQWPPRTGEGPAKWNQVMMVGRSRAALYFLPESEDIPGGQYPEIRWVRDLLTDGVRYVHLDVAKVRRPCPPSLDGPLASDGANLAWAVHRLRTDDPQAFDGWLKHVRTAIADIRGVATTVRDEDRHCVIRVEYASGLSVPTWLVSDGTLRLLALTLLAYYPWPSASVFMIEEPGNGIHPSAAETVFDSLRSMWNHQVLLATHSPALLRMATARQILCFARDEDGNTDIVGLENHPRLAGWQDEVDLDTLNAAGVLS